MKPKYEVAKLNEATITVDVSLLAKTEEMYFNATQMAKPFGKRPAKWLESREAQEYIDAILEVRNSDIGYSGLVRTTKGGKYQGTWLHNDLGLAFARWLSPLFAVRLDQWTRERLKQEESWHRQRLESKTGFLPMAEAVQEAHEHPEHYHFSNEADMINRIVLGMSSKAFREEHGVKRVRDALTAEQLKEINRLQQINTGLLQMGWSYAARKDALIEANERPRWKELAKEAA